MENTGQRPLTLPQIAKAAEVEYGTLHSWLKRGLLTPSLQASTGTGSPNLFTLEDLLTAKVLGDLRRAGVDFDSLEQAARELQVNRQQLRGNEMLVINGRVELLDGSRPISSALRGSEPAIVYPLAVASATVKEFTVSSP